jgi:hypothetical protein
MAALLAVMGAMSGVVPATASASSPVESLCGMALLGYRIC